MASKMAATPAFENPSDHYFQEAITIERREIIARLTAGINGELPIALGFKVCAEFITEHGRIGESIDLQFTYGDHTFHATAVPVLTDKEKGVAQKGDLPVSEW